MMRPFVNAMRLLARIFYRRKQYDQAPNKNYSPAFTDRSRPSQYAGIGMRQQKRTAHPPPYHGRGNKTASNRGAATVSASDKMKENAEEKM